LFNKGLLKTYLLPPPSTIQTYPKKYFGFFCEVKFKLENNEKSSIVFTWNIDYLKMTLSNDSKSHSSIYKRLLLLIEGWFPNSASYSELIEKGVEYRPHYAYCLYNAAIQAKRLGLSEITAIEFGVAMGGGLTDLEYLSKKIERRTQVKINIVGFDFGEGLSPTNDHRDLLYLWQPGDYMMNEDALKAKLTFAKLILGDVKTTLPNFLKTELKAPIGAMFVDLDYYTSTINCLDPMLTLDSKMLLPRTYVYLDDLTYTSKYTGEFAAVEEFNIKSEFRKIDEIKLLSELLALKWLKWLYLGRRIFWLHIFDHSLYNIRDINDKSSIQDPLPW